MVKTKLSSKGQVTLPKEVREFLGIQAGDGVRFEIRGDEVVVRPFRRQNLESLLGSLSSTVPYRGREAEREAMEAGMAAELVRSLEPKRQQ
jgi:AbrB family looped-hinge helix DNA binding protein